LPSRRQKHDNDPHQLLVEDFPMRPRSRRGYGLFNSSRRHRPDRDAARMLLPAVQKVRESARRAQSGNNLKQIALALPQLNDSIGNLPSGVDDNSSRRCSLLPYIEQSAVQAPT